MSKIVNKKFVRETRQLSCFKDEFLRGTTLVTSHYSDNGLARRVLHPYGFLPKALR